MTTPPLPESTHHQPELDTTIEGVARQTPETVARRLFLLYQEDHCQAVISGIEAYIRDSVSEGPNKSRQLTRFPGFSIEDIKQSLELLKSLIKDNLNSEPTESEIIKAVRDRAAVAPYTSTGQSD